MTSFQATLVNAGYGQLALRDQNGKIAQKWTLGGPKCVIGAHANCNVRCMLPGIADHHLLLVVGGRQIYMRALAPGVERDGVAVNELVLSGDHTQLAFSLAGHRFEYSRVHSTVPITQSLTEVSTSSSAAKPIGDAAGAPKRLRFTFVQALEKNRARNEASPEVAAAVEGTSERPAWVEEIVRDALRPVELRLETIAEPINNLQRQLRRQRARMRKQQQARKLQQHAAHDVGHSHTQNLIEAQENVQRIVTDQSARLELVNERVSEIVNQLATLERIVAVENVQHQEVVNRTSQSSQEIIHLQREMMALVSALQSRIAEPPVASEEDAQWRASIQRQVAELHQSLGILDEIKSSLQLAVSQNRQLSQEMEARWQTIEEIAQRPIVAAAPLAPAPLSPSQSALPPAEPLDASALGFSQAEAAADVEPEVQQRQQQPAWPQAESSFATEPLAAESDEPKAFEAAGFEPKSFEPIAFDRAPLESYEQPTYEQPTYEQPTYEQPSYEQPSYEPVSSEPLSAPRDFAVVDGSSSAEPVALPSWWTEDPVIANDAQHSVDFSRPEESPPSDHAASNAPFYDAEQSLAALASDSIARSPAPAAAEQGHASSNDWPLTDYEQESGSHEPLWSNDPPAYGGAKNDYPELDVPQLLASAIADSPASLQELPRPNPEPAIESKYAEQTFDEDDIRDVSQSVNQSATALEERLNQWLSEDYHASDQDRPEATQPFSTLPIDQAAIECHDPADETYFTGSMLDQRHEHGAIGNVDERAIDHADDQEYAVSAFSAERLAIEEVSPEQDLQYQDPSETAAHSSYENSYQGADETSEQASDPLPSSGQNDAAVSSDGSDESVEEYMRRLLARMRGVSESEVELPGLDAQPSSRPQPKPAAPLASAGLTVANGTGDTQPASGAWTEPFDPMKYVPRVTAPEKAGDLDAMRELANTSARSAINVSARRKHLTAIMIKTGVSLVGLAAGAALVSINGFRVNIGLIATMASFMVALIWGYDALATLRPLLQANRAAKSQIAKVSADESEDEAS